MGGASFLFGEDRAISFVGEAIFDMFEESAADSRKICQWKGDGVGRRYWTLQYVRHGAMGRDGVKEE